MNRFLALDYGYSKIGIATGNQQSALATPLGIIKAHKGTPDETALKKIIQEWKPDCIVVGLPLNMDGTEDELSEQARAFAKSIEETHGIPTKLHDERLSSFEAKIRAKEAGFKGEIDAFAAAIILEDFFSVQ